MVRGPRRDLLCKYEKQQLCFLPKIPFIYLQTLTNQENTHPEDEASGGAT